MAGQSSLRDLGGGAYTFNRTFSDDETIEFAFRFRMRDRTAFPWADYELEYSVDDGAVSLDQDAGITVDEAASVATFHIGDPGALSIGDHAHGFRVREIATDKVTQVFTGILTIKDGGFR